MPNNQTTDIIIDGRGFMLARGRNKGRSWRRTSVASVPGGSSPDEARYGTTSPNMRFKEVFDDFSGGDGYAYRTVAPANGVHWSENVDCRFPGQAVHVQALRTLNPVAHASTHYDADGFFDLAWTPDVSASATYLASPWKSVLVLGRRYEAYLQPTGLATEASAIVRYLGNVAAPAGEQRYKVRPAVFGSFLYLPRQQEASGLDVSTFLQRGRDNGVTTSALPAHGFANAGPRLWRYHGPRYGDTNAHYVQNIAAGADPLGTANWGFTQSVGDGDTPIKDMIALEQQVFCGLADGVYASDQSGTFFNVTPDLANQRNPDNCRDLAVHEGEVVIPHVSGIFAYNPTTTNQARLRQISAPARSARSPVNGRDRCLRSYAGWLYAGRWTGSLSYLRAGREVSPGDWRWYTLHRLPDVARVHRLHFDGIFEASGGTPVPNRLWVATDMSINTGGTAPVYWSPIPRNNHNPLAPDPVFSANYAGSARLVLPAIDRGAPGVAKIGEAIEVWADGFLSGSRYADVYYAADRGTRTLLGRAQTSPVSTLLMGSTNGSFPTFRSLEIDIESFNTTPGTCQVYRSVVLTGNLRPDYVETIEALVTIADDQPDRRGTPMRPGSVQIDDLRDFAAPLRHGNVPHQLTDLAGATSYVVFDGMPVESESYQEGSENPELLAQVTMVVLTLSQNTQ